MVKQKNYGLGYNTLVLNLHINGYLSANTLNPLTHRDISLILSFFKALINNIAFLNDKTYTSKLILNI